MLERLLDWQYFCLRYHRGRPPHILIGRMRSAVSHSLKLLWLTRNLEFYMGLKYSFLPHPSLPCHTYSTFFRPLILWPPSPPFLAQNKLSPCASEPLQRTGWFLSPGICFLRRLPRMSKTGIPARDPTLLELVWPRPPRHSWPGCCLFGNRADVRETGLTRYLVALQATKWSLPSSCC